MAQDQAQEVYKVTGRRRCVKTRTGSSLKELSAGIRARPLQCGLSRREMMMLSQEVTVELLNSDGSNYASWSFHLYNTFSSLGPEVEQIFDASVLPINIDMKNPSEHDLRCLHQNYQAYDILVNSLSKDVYFAVIGSNSDVLVDAHDLWTRIKIKYSESNCTTSTPYVACGTNLSKGEEKRWQPNDESTSPTGLSSTSYTCLVANDKSGDESDEEEEYEDEESTSSQGTFSCFASTNNNDRENETDDVKEEEIRYFYTHLNKEDKALLVKLLRRNKEQGEMLLRLEETLIKTNDSLEKMTKEHEELKCSHDDLV
jgi:hypothetical protein